MRDVPGSFLQHIETLFDAGALGEQTDRQLLDRFTAGDRASAESAFTVLVKRHGPLVYRACRAILRDPHAAEDAFQATFLVLARKARALWVRDSLGPWLLSVAGRVASCARAEAARRNRLDHLAAERSTTVSEPPGWDDRDAVLHQELGRLPETYRTAVMLCDLEGLTQEEAARRLGWPAGTVRSRLARGRRRLRERLTRRGLAPAILFARPSPRIEAAPESVVQTTVQAVSRLASSGTAIGVSASAISSMEGALRFMSWSPLKSAAAVLTAGALITGTGVLGYRAMGRVQTPPAGPGQPPAVSTPPARNPAPPAAAVAAVAAESPELVAIGKARLDVVRRMRDAAEGLWRNGQMSLVDYLSWQKRLDEVVAEITVRTDADRIRFLEGQVATLKRIEQAARKQFDSGQVTRLDVLNAELARLDVEYALAKLRAKSAGDAK